jgi:DNA-binding CsgD family transcriptional regulator
MEKEMAQSGEPGRRWHADSTFTCLLDQFSYGVLIVSAKWHLVSANAAGRRELARRRPFLVEQGVLGTADEHDTAAVRTALLNANTGKRSLITLSDSNGACLPVAVLPVVANAYHEHGAALILSRATVCDPLMLCFYARSKGMTRTEEVVLGMLGDGKTAPEIAAELRLSTSTVRSHIQSLCKKARATSIRAVMNQLAKLPPLHASVSLFALG